MAYLASLLACTTLWMPWKWSAGHMLMRPPFMLTIPNCEKSLLISQIAQLCQEMSFKDKIKGRIVKRQFISQHSYWVILLHFKIKLVFVWYLFLNCVVLPFSLPCHPKLDCPSLWLHLAKEIPSSNGFVEKQERFLPSFFPLFLSSSLIFV